MSLLSRLAKLFSSGPGDDAAAEREEFGLPDPGEAELRRERFGPPYAPGAAAEAAEQELDTFKAPREPYE
jgi:hypothetical protein